MPTTHTISTDTIPDGTNACEVRDRGFACALLSIGAEYLDPADPFSLLERADGTVMEFWRLKRFTRSGLDLRSLLGAQADPEAWVIENSGHPLAYALCALINARYTENAVRKSRPMVGFRLPDGGNMFVFRDSRKHRRLEAIALAHPDKLTRI